MVVRGTRVSLARARNIRSARRSRSSRILSNRSNKSTSSSKTNSTSNTQSTSKTNQLAMYEELQKTADELQKTAKTLLGLGEAVTTDTSEITKDAATADSTTAEADAAQTAGKAEEERKKEIIEGVKDLVEQYNTMYKALGKLGGTVNTLYASQLKSLLGNEKTALEKTGVVMNKDGTLSITAKTLEGTDLSTLQEVYCKSGSIMEKLMDKGEKVESNASATISVMNRMYGTSTYNKYGSSSPYYAGSGSWYNAIG